MRVALVATATASEDLTARLLEEMIRRTAAVPDDALPMNMFLEPGLLRAEARVAACLARAYLPNEENA